MDVKGRAILLLILSLIRLSLLESGKSDDTHTSGSLNKSGELEGRELFWERVLSWRYEEDGGT